MFSITPLQESDIADMYQEIKESKEYLEELGWVAECAWDRFYRHYVAIIQMQKLNIYAIRVDGNYAGSVEIADRQDHYVIGYWLGIKYRAKGIATEAVKSVLGQLDHRPVKADTLASNPRSARLLERLGFQLERTNSTNNFYKLTKLEVDKV